MPRRPRLPRSRSRSRSRRGGSRRSPLGSAGPRRASASAGRCASDCTQSASLKAAACQRSGMLEGLTKRYIQHRRVHLQVSDIQCVFSRAILGNICESGSGQAISRVLARIRPGDRPLINNHSGLKSMPEHRVLAQVRALRHSGNFACPALTVEQTPQMYQCFLKVFTFERSPHTISGCQGDGSTFSRGSARRILPVRVKPSRCVQRGLGPIGLILPFPTMAWLA